MNLVLRIPVGWTREELIRATCAHLFTLHSLGPGGVGSLEGMTHRWLTGPWGKRKETVISYLRHVHTNYDDVLQSYPALDRQMMRGVLKDEIRRYALSMYPDLG